MSVTFCSVVYESAKPYLKDFIDGIIHASKQIGSLDIILISDGLKNASEALAPLYDNFPVTLINAHEGDSIPSIRNLLFDTARSHGKDKLIFSDCDDVLEPEAFIEHIHVLEKYDFSFSDQILINSQGQFLDKRLYDNWTVPDKVTSYQSLLDGNFIGFSGVAINREVLDNYNYHVPEGVLAVDWWFFSNILLQGAKGAKTKLPVVCYRQHDENIHGATSQSDKLSIMNRVKIGLSHFKNLPPLPEIIKRYDALKLLQQGCDSHFEEYSADIEKLSKKARFFYEDVVLLALEEY